jgi:exodeoxyribonuclease V gamma subunit
VCAAETARGLLPPGALGHEALADARSRAEAIAATARAEADGRRLSLEVEVVLADGRTLVGTVPDVIGDTIRPTTFSKVGPKPMLRAWVHLLAATASNPGRALTSATIGRDREAAATTFRLPAIDHGSAVDLLTGLIELRDEGLREPIPLYCATSHRFVEAERAGMADPGGQAAKFWTTTFGYPKEDLEAEHMLVLGGQRSFDGIISGGRFASVARRLWDPVFDAARQARS